MRNKVSDFGSTPGAPWGDRGVKITRNPITQSKLDGFVSNLIWIFRAVGDMIYITVFAV